MLVSVTNLRESVRTRGELPQLHVEVFVVRVLFLRLQVMVSLGASWERRQVQISDVSFLNAFSLLQVKKEVLRGDLK